MKNTPIVSVVGKKNSGKTTLVEKLIKELKNRGYRLASVKHDAHSFDIDHPGKDSWRHGQAGADIVAISSPEKLAMIEKTDREPTLDEVVSRMTPVDLVITEGFKRSNKIKIEVFRKDAGHEGLLCEKEELLAVASDVHWEIDVPVYNIDDVDGIVKEIENFVKNFSG